VYERPGTSFVAGFVGTSNVLPAPLSERLLGVAAPHTVRPERIRLADGSPPRDGDVETEATIEDVQYLGAESRVRARLGDGTVLVVSVPSDRSTDAVIGSAVNLTWPRQAASAVLDSTDITSTEQGENQ